MNDQDPTTFTHPYLTPDGHVVDAPNAPRGPTLIPGYVARSHQYGRRWPKGAAALDFARYLAPAATIPPHPAAEDFLARLRGGWQMLGNASYSDCVPVTWANFRRTMSVLYGPTEDYPTIDEVVALYRTQNPDFDPNGSSSTNGPGSSADGGMDIQTVLEYLQAHGGPDGVKPVCFGRLTPTDTDSIHAALNLFVCLWVGCVVTQANEDQFAAGQPWDFNPSSPQLGGHSVLGGGYTATDGQQVVTWAQETSFTVAFEQHQVEELWVVLWPEHLSDERVQAGVDLAALAADFTALTGRPFPAPVPPTPTPPPAPAPVPPGVDQALAAALTRYLSHYSGPRYLVAAATPWLAAQSQLPNRKDE